METFVGGNSQLTVREKFFDIIKGGLILVVIMIVVFVIFNVIIKGEFLTQTNINVILAHTVSPAFIA